MTTYTANDLYDMFANQADDAAIAATSTKDLALDIAELDTEANITDYTDAAEAVKTIARQLCAAKYGTVTHNGVSYTLIDVADMSSRLMPYKPYHEAEEGDEYEFEMTANAVDDDGNLYQVAWIFEAVKGDEPELDSYDYGTPDKVTAR